MIKTSVICFASAVLCYVPKEAIYDLLIQYKTLKMGLIFDSFVTDFFTIILFLFTSLFIYSKYVFQHWSRNKVVQVTPSFPFGNMKECFVSRETFSSSFERVYKELKEKDVRFGGFYFSLKPMLMIIDPELNKHIMVKDFQHFTDRGTYTDEENDPLNAHLFHLEGDKWKNLRAKLSPTFTSGKMKMMFNILKACSDELDDVVSSYASNKETIDIKYIMNRFTSDIIGSCAFGIECNGLKDRDGDSEFIKYSQLALEPKGFDKIRHIGLFMPSLLKFFGLPIFNNKVKDFFTRIVTETVRYREDNNVTRKDFLQLLIQMKTDGKISNQVEDVIDKDTREGITIQQIVSQCFVFFTAGFETSATTITFCMYEIVKNLDIQEKLRQEVFTVLNKYNNELTYEAIMEMTYMDKVIKETLRKYPPLGFLNRKCTKDYKIPNSNYTIRKGDSLIIAPMGLHRDPEFYPNPDVFDPERFSPEAQAERHQFVYVPFGEGPRICIGMRFGLMQTKVALSVLLKKYRFTLNQKTGEAIQFDPQNAILSVKGGMWLNVNSL